MLQRAASNAYSWWWASHIRTKQSKWLEQNLQDMEEKVQSVLKLIEEDGDSFAKRAEMYYKKRPELINFVEESYRAYRALADRYDHMSTELQNANNTIAYVFPEQVQFAMEDEDEEMSTKTSKKSDGPKSNVPKVPKLPKDLKGFISSATKKFQHKKPNKLSAGPSAPRSGLGKSEGLKEIDKLQKHILALQTEKEFVKSSYEGGVAKYWEIDQEIRELQERVCYLQDEFGAGIVIEDDEARTLMASVALKSCQDTLAQLKEKQQRSAEEAAVEQRRIEDAREKLKSLKGEILRGLADEEAVQANERTTKEAEEVKRLDQAVNNQIQEREDLEALCDKIKEQFDIGSTLTVTELAEKIDDLVNKVISLETAISSQTALIQSLRSETDDLQAQIRGLENDKSTLIDEKRDISDKLKEMEDKIFELRNMSQRVEEQKSNLKIHFVEANVNLEHLSQKLQNVKPDEEAPVTQAFELVSLANVESQAEFEVQASTVMPHSSLGKRGDVNPKEKDEVEPPPTKVGSPAKLESPAELTGQAGVEKQDYCVRDLLEVKPEKKLTQSHEDLKGQEDSPSSDAIIGKQLNSEQEKETPNQQKKVDSSLPEADKQAEAKEKEYKLEQLEKIGDISTSNKETTSQCQTREISNDSPKHVQDPKIEEKAGEEASSSCGNDSPDGGTKELKTEDEDEPDWKQLFMNGLENREKVLLSEYTSVLRNFKEAKKKLTEAEKKDGKSLFDVTMQLKELKNANAKKDEQIRVLREKVRLLQSGISNDNESDKLVVTETPKKEKQDAADLKELLMGPPEKTSEIEEKLRGSIDELLEENLDFWLRFSSTFQQIQKFEAEVKDLQSEAAKLEERIKKQEGSSTPRLSLKSDAKPLYKHLREIHAELTVWIEKSTVLKEELKSRFASLCDIQEEITAALKDSAEDEDIRFTSYQAAKFQGEILNMKQENNKVADELQAGLDHVTTLQLEVERSLAKLNDRFKLSGSKNRPNIQLQHSESRSRVPLRSFIFGVKPKKQKNSIFSCMHPTLHRKYHGLRLHPSK